MLVPFGYTVEMNERKLQFAGERVLRQALVELPVLLLTLDRRTRLFLTEDELAEISSQETAWIPSHPASRAIELSLQGRPTPLRFLLPPGAAPATEKDEPENCELLASPIATTLVPSIEISPSQREFAVKSLSRMNIDRNWLIYLPPAIASVQARAESDDLERPEEALSYFRDERIGKAIVEEKHMGSRGIVVVCRSLEAARERFGVIGEVPGFAYTRNGRRFFGDEDTQAVFLDRVNRVLARANFLRTGCVSTVKFFHGR